MGQGRSHGIVAKKPGNELSLIAFELNAGQANLLRPAHTMNQCYLFILLGQFFPFCRFQDVRIVRQRIAHYYRESLEKGNPILPGFESAGIHVEIDVENVLNQGLFQVHIAIVDESPGSFLEFLLAYELSREYVIFCAMEHLEVSQLKYADHGKKQNQCSEEIDPYE